MNRKLLPLPIGAAAPQGSEVRQWQQHGARARADSVTLLVGLLLACLGAWLGVQPRSTTLTVDRASYRLGSLVLPRIAATEYSGDAAVVIETSAGVTRGAATGRLAGSSMQGVCVHVDGTDTEQCVFVVGRRSFHAVDRIRAQAWERTYDDGEKTVIRLNDPRLPQPVPLPVGWHGN